MVLVTGASRGIGKEVARQLAACGASVLASARDADHARAAAKEISVAGDEHDPGRLDVLINNAAAYVDWSGTASGADLSAARKVHFCEAGPASVRVGGARLGQLFGR